MPGCGAAIWVAKLPIPRIFPLLIAPGSLTWAIAASKRFVGMWNRSCGNLIGMNALREAKPSAGVVGAGLGARLNDHGSDRQAVHIGEHVIVAQHEHLLDPATRRFTKHPTVPTKAALSGAIDTPPTIGRTFRRLGGMPAASAGAPFCAADFFAAAFFAARASAS